MVKQQCVSPIEKCHKYNNFPFLHKTVDIFYAKNANQYSEKHNNTYMLNPITLTLTQQKSTILSP